MIKTHNENIHKFIEFINKQYPTPQDCYIHFCEGDYEVIEVPNSEEEDGTIMVGEGIYCSETDDVYVIINENEKETLHTIAHEYRHFMQKYLGYKISDIERDADHFAEIVIREFECDIKEFIESCEDCGFCIEFGKERK